MTLFNAGRVELAAHNSVTKADVFHAATANENDRVLLQVMPFAGNVRCDFHSICKPHTGDFSDGRVWLAGSFCRDTSANAALERRGIIARAIFNRVKTARKRDRFRSPSFLFAPFPRKLIYC